MSQGRRRNRNRNRNQSSQGKAGNAQAQGKSKQRQGSGKRNEPKIDPVEFWGDPELLPEPVTAVEPVPDVNAMVRSLGRVPLTGHETAAEHWFSLVYERSAVLAGALAAAGGLDTGADDSTAR